MVLGREIIDEEPSNCAMQACECISIYSIHWNALWQTSLVELAAKIYLDEKNISHNIYNTVEDTWEMEIRV